MEQPDISLARLKRGITRMQKAKILVVGDLMLDKFVRGTVSRISQEAPIPVVHVTDEHSFAGGSANVARNLSDFGIECGVCGVMGKDEVGQELIGLLKRQNISTKGLFVEGRFSTIVKTRIIARQQQVVRVDYEKPIRLSTSQFDRMARFLAAEIPNYDAVIIEDYGKGTITQAVFDEVAEICKKNDKIITVDPNPRNVLSFHDVTAVKPNRLEAFQAARREDVGGLDAVRDAGFYLLDRWVTDQILITLGEQGMMLFIKGETEPYHTPTRAKEVYDVSGAGDTSIAFYTAALVANFNPAEAAEIANHAAGIVVGKSGTATVSPDELLRSFDELGDIL
ncbi:MAG: bifunctional heptose 7-phosphate kinase/heptose 1-phosphate adenyltransferase [Candidatus Methylacidiphilales bacterium]